jgi:predicted acetylornithine/succinylornithine family transaminase
MLAKKLTDISGFGKVFICNSGTEATEAAIKLARKYAKSISAGKIEIVTCEGSFHGRTYGSLSATGQRKYQTDFEPLVPGFRHIPFNDCEALEGAVGDATCAVMVEPVLGESGVFPASEGFIRCAREVCDRSGALLIFDEVQTGLGRTGRLFAFQHFGVEPDVLTLAKGLGTGFPVAAVLARGKAAEAFSPGDHGTTFGGGPVACAAAIACIEEVEKKGLAERARSLGEAMMSRLRSIAADFPVISQVRGLGLMVGVDTEGARAGELRRACLDRGLLIASSSERTVRLLPPLVISEGELEDGLEAFRLAAEGMMKR